MNRALCLALLSLAAIVLMLASASSWAIARAQGAALSGSSGGSGSHKGPQATPTTCSTITYVFTSTDVPIHFACPLTPGNSIINITGTLGLITDVDVVNVDISFPDISSLKLYLFHTFEPSPFSLLADTPCDGQGSHNFPDISFDSAAQWPIGHDCPPVAGMSYQPADPLPGSLAGQAANGAWSLHVGCDTGTSGEGTINSWGLRIATSSCPVGTPQPTASPTHTRTPSPTTSGTVTVTPTACPDGNWHLDTPLPEPFMGAAVAAVGNDLYVAGGLHGDQGTYLVHKYSGSGSWTRVADLPNHLWDAAVASDGANLYVIGGYTDTNLDGITSSTYAYNPATNTWSGKAQLPYLGGYGGGLAAASAVYMNGQIHVIGGCLKPDCKLKNTHLLTYDIANNRWSQNDDHTYCAGSSLDFSCERAGAAAWAVDGYIYVAGGLWNIGGTCDPEDDDCERTSFSAARYHPDPADPYWPQHPELIANLPRTIWGAASVVLNGRPYLLGGVINGYDTVSNRVLSYDTATNSWTSESNLNVATFRQQAAVQSGKIYVAGGSIGGFTATDRVEHYDLLFRDVPPGSTFYPFARCLACGGILTGYSDGTFRPTNPMTRGQLAKIVSNAAGFSDPVSGQTFEDAPPGSPFYEYVERLASRSIVGGYRCGGEGEPCVPPANRPYFRPSSEVSRGQASKLVATAAGFLEPVSGQTFEDIPSGSTFYAYIERLASRSIVGGYRCGGEGEPCVSPDDRSYFRAGNYVTRGQAAKIVSITFFPDCNAVSQP